MKHPFAQFLIERDLVPKAAARRLIEQNRFLREPIGMIAVSHSLLKPDEIDVILDRQRVDQDRQRFGDIAVELGFLTRDQVETLAKIQEFRMSAHIAEALALAGTISYEDAGTYLGAFLMRDREVAAIMAGE